MKIKFITLGICFLLFLTTGLFAEKAIILKQEDAPLKITEFKTSCPLGVTIFLSVKYLNTSEKNIVATRFRFVVFNVFDEFIKKFSAVSIEKIGMNKEKKGSWDEQPVGGIFDFQKYGIGLVYIDAVRFEDGTIWKTNRENILLQIQEIQESFTLDLLAENINAGN